LELDVNKTTNLLDIELEIVLAAVVLSAGRLVSEVAVRLASELGLAVDILEVGMLLEEVGMLAECAVTF